MKTRRILAASTAALLAFGATAVIASAATTDQAVGNDPDGANVKGSISVDGGTTYVVTALKDYTKTEDGTAVDGTNGDKAGYKTLLGSATLSETVNDVTVGISVDNAMKLNGKYAFKITTATVDEADDELADVGDDSAIKDTGVNADALKILGKTKASEVKVFNITAGKDGKSSKYDGKMTLDVTVANTFKGAKVYHVDDDGNLQLVKSTPSVDMSGNRSTEFSTSKFSPFIITTADLKVTAAPADESSDASDTSGAASTNPETGIALAIAPVVLAAGAVAVVALKKKH